MWPIQLILLSLLLSSPVFAREIKALKVFNNNKGASFPATDDISPDSSLYAYTKNKENKLSLYAILKVERCDIEECAAKVVKIKKGATLFTNTYYSTTNLSAKRPKGKSIPKKQYAFGTIGGPLVQGFNAGYLRALTNKLHWGLKGGIIDSVIGKVGVKGNYLALQIDQKLIKASSFELNPYGEVGYIQAKLDFETVGGPKFKDSVPYIGAGINLWWHWPSFFLIGRLGQSYNFFRPTYEDESAVWALPFKGSLIIFEFGGGFVF